MPTGSCMCSAIKFSYQGDPVFTAVCYCNDDRKMSDMSVFQIPTSNFQLTAGTPKTWTKTSDWDRDITNHFCDTCGTVLFRTGGSPNVEGMIGVRAGVLDDQSIINETTPAIEVFVERRPKWRKEIDGAIQMNSKYEVVGGHENWNKVNSETGAKAGGEE